MLKQLNWNYEPSTGLIGQHDEQSQHAHNAIKWTWHALESADQ